MIGAVVAVVVLVAAGVIVGIREMTGTDRNRGIRTGRTAPTLWRCRDCNRPVHYQNTPGRFMHSDHVNDHPVRHVRRTS